MFTLLNSSTELIVLEDIEEKIFEVFHSGKNFHQGVRELASSEGYDAEELLDFSDKLLQKLYELNILTH